MRNAVCRNLYTKISSGNHNSVCLFDDLINIFNTFCILNLCNNSNLLSAILIQKCSNLTDDICGTDKRGRNKIKSLLNSKQNVLSVFLCNTRKLYFYIRHIHAFSFAKFSSVEHLTDNLCTFGRNHFQFNQAIVNQNSGACAYIFRQSLIRNRNTLLIALDFLRCQCKLLPV